MPENIRWPFLLVVDTTSRYIYTFSLRVVSPPEVRKAFLHLFRNGMPYFPILRMDRDVTIKSLRSFFEKKDMLIRPKRGIHKLSLLEPLMKVLKRKLIRHLKKHPEDYSDGRRRDILQEATHSINNTVSSSHGRTPAQVNSPMMDPFLRKVLYPNHKIQPFDVFLTEQLKLQKKVNTEDPVGKKNMKEGPKDFRVNQTVYIDFESDGKLGRRYGIQRGKIYRVHRVETSSDPWLYQLKDLHNRIIDGFFYGSELAHADLDDLEVDKVIRKKKTADGRMLALVSFKGYDRCVCHSLH